MNYYGYGFPSKTEIELVEDVVASCSAGLKIDPPKFIFVEKVENEQGSILKHEINGAGFACPSAGKNGCIYIVLPADSYSMIKTTAHECYHIYQGKNNLRASEEAADSYAITKRNEICASTIRMRSLFFNDSYELYNRR